MDNNILDNHLAQKNLKQILSDIKKAGYRNSFMHKKGYIISKKSGSAKIRIVLDKDGQSVVSIVPLGAKEVVLNTIFLIVFIVLGGIFLILAIAYILTSTVSFFVSLPKSRKFKTEIENILRLSPSK